MDFGQYSTTNNAYVRLYWIGGTVLSVSTVGIALCYIVTMVPTEPHEHARPRSRRQRFAHGASI